MSAPGRLLLVRHGGTTATRRGMFPTDEPLDDTGQADSARLAVTVSALLRGHGDPARVAHELVSPALRARQTAAAAGLDAEVDQALRPWNLGSWTGARLTSLDPEDLIAWRSHPEFAPPGGESLHDLTQRVGGWLARWADRLDVSAGSVVAVTHSAVIRAALALAVDGPAELAWRFDVAPAATVALSRHLGAWHIGHVNRAPSAVDQ